MRGCFKIALLLMLPLLVEADDYLSPGITPSDLESKLDAADAPRVIDLRKPEEFGVAHVPGAVNIPLAELEQRLDEVRHESGVVIYCINGSRTLQAEPILYNHGIDNLSHLEGTFFTWIREQRPIEKGGVKKSGW